MKKIIFTVSIFCALSSFPEFIISAPQKEDAMDQKTLSVPIKREQIDEIPNVVYSQIHTTRSVRQMHMSLLVPRTKAGKSVILYFPGGGFSSADYGKFIEMRMALAQAGFVVAAVEYRVIPDQFPAPVVDAKSAVRYLREHAKDYGINIHKIGVLGDSAGGWLSQMLGTTNGEQTFDQGDFLNQSSDVQAVVSLYGISNLLNIGEGFPEDIQKVHASPAVTESLLVNGPAFSKFSGAAITNDPKKALYASPMGHLKGKKPPFLLMNGSNDTLVSPIQSQQMYKALQESGNQVDYVVLKDAGHGDIYWFQQPIVDYVVSWFKKVLNTPDLEYTKKDMKESIATDNL